MIYVIVEYGYHMSFGQTIHSYYTSLADAEAAMETVKYETCIQENIKLWRKEHVNLKKYKI
jgi:hypothetical protein